MTGIVDAVRSFLRACGDRSWAARWSSTKQWENDSTDSKTLRPLLAKLEKHLQVCQTELQAWQEYVVELTKGVSLLKSKLETSAVIRLQVFFRASLLRLSLGSAKSQKAACSSCTNTGTMAQLLLVEEAAEREGRSSSNIGSTDAAITYPVIRSSNPRVFKEEQAQHTIAIDTNTCGSIYKPFSPTRSQLACQGC